MKVWKPISWNENYLVSEDGEVFSIRSGKIVKPGIRGSRENNKYAFYKFKKDGKYKSYSIHRIVAEIFIENKKNKRSVNHINGIKTDNRAANLEWVTDSENTLHAYRTGLKKRLKGYKFRGKLNFDDIPKIKDMYSNGLGQKQIADIFNVTQSNISKIINNVSWS